MLANDVVAVSLDEFEAMDRDERFNYELIDGIVMMSPTPSREHQRTALELAVILHSALKHHQNCQPLYELAIQFNGNIYRPDLMVFCDINDEIPEIVFEILSPSTKYHDLTTKVLKYREMGVKEYWIVDLKLKTVIVHDFINHYTETYGIDDTIQSTARSEIVIKVKDIFN